MKKIILFLTVLLICSLFVKAEIIVERTVPERIKVGDILTAEVSLKNTGEKTEELTITQTITSGEPIEPAELTRDQTPEGMRIGVRPPYFKWQINLSRGEEKKIIYKLKYKTPAKIMMNKIEVKTKSGGAFYSESHNIIVFLPQNGVCEPELGENSRNSPEDCPRGSKDGICDLGENGVCDPDCIPEADPDCADILNKKEFPTAALILITMIIIVIIAGVIIFKKKK